MQKRILSNLSWLAMDKGCRILGGVVVGVLVARHLGPEQFGILNYAIAFVFLFSFMSDLGLRQIVIREIKNVPEQQEVLLGTAFVIKLAGGFIAFALAYLLALLLMPAEPELQLLVLIIAAGFIFQSLDVIDYFYQSRIQSRPVVISRNLAYLVSAALKIAFIALDLGVAWFALAGTIDLMIAAILMIYSYRKLGRFIFRWKTSLNLSRQLLMYSWPLMLSTFLISVHMRVDQIMIGTMLDDTRVGLYSVAVRLSEFWYFMPTIIVSTLLPYFVELRKQDPVSYTRKLTQLYSLMFWMGMLVGTLVMLWGEPLIVVLFGQDYQNSYQALVWNIWAGIFVAQGLARGIWMVAEDLQKYRVYSNVFAVLLNVGLNLLLIPRFGIKGAALSTLATQALALWGFSMLLRPLRKSTTDLMRSVNPVYLLKGARQ